MKKEKAFYYGLNVSVTQMPIIKKRIQKSFLIAIVGNSVHGKMNLKDMDSKLPT